MLTAFDLASMPSVTTSENIASGDAPNSSARSLILTFLLAKVQASVLFCSGAPPAHSCSLTTEPSAAWNCISPVSSLVRHSPAA